MVTTTTTNGNGRHRTLIATDPPADTTGSPAGNTLTDNKTLTTSLCIALNTAPGDKPGHFEVDKNDPTVLNYLNPDDAMTLRLDVGNLNWIAQPGQPIPILVSRHTLTAPDMEDGVTHFNGGSDATIYTGPWISAAADKVWRELPWQIREYAEAVERRDRTEQRTRNAQALRDAVLHIVPGAQEATFCKGLIQGHIGPVSWNFEASETHAHLNFTAPAGELPRLVAILQALYAKETA